MTNSPLKQEAREAFVEEGAALEHTRWAKWQEYLHSVCTKNEDGSLNIPASYVERWERQIVTLYSELSEHEKESDRDEVRQYLPLLDTWLDRAYEAGKTDGVRELNKALIGELVESGRGDIVEAALAEIRSTPKA